MRAKGPPLPVSTPRPGAATRSNNPVVKAKTRRASSAAKPPSQRPHRTQAARSKEARESLMQATIDALIHRGYNGLSIKEVASRAGLSRGALAHHYPTKGELVVAATAAVYDEALLRGRRLALEAASVHDPVGNFAKDCMSVYFDWPFLAALEIIMVARTDKALMRQIEPVMQHYRTETNATWLAVFRRAGIKRADSERILNLTLNLVRGIAVNSLWQMDQARNKRLLRDWTRQVDAQWRRDGAARSTAVA